MRVCKLEAAKFGFAAWQARQGQFGVAGQTATLLADRRRGCWRPGDEPALIGVTDEGDEIEVLQGLPEVPLSLAEAEWGDAKLGVLCGWRKRFSGEQPEWERYCGHPVAVRTSDSGRRWAALVFRVGESGWDEILLDQDLQMDGPTEAGQVQMVLFQ